MDADTWTKSTRDDASTVPSTVAADNGFAALGLPERLVERLARDGITDAVPDPGRDHPRRPRRPDVLGRGQTGSGKTLAFGLPMLARLADGAQGRARDARAPSSSCRPASSPCRSPTRSSRSCTSLGLRHKLVAGGLPLHAPRSTRSTAASTSSSPRRAGSTT